MLGTLWPRCVPHLFLSALLCACPADVAKAVKALPADDILRYEREGSIEVEGHRLEAGDIKVCGLGGVPDLSPASSMVSRLLPAMRCRSMHIAQGPSVKHCLTVCRPLLIHVW